jgi:Flp pilus assembly protein TadD
VFAFLAVLTGLVYAQTIRNEFVYDDTLLIQENKLFQRLEAIPQLFVSDWWKGAEEDLGRQPGTRDRRYRPLAAVTYVLNHAVTGAEPWGYHLVNLLLHAAVGMGVYLLALSLGWAAGPALVAAALFVIHPLHTEAVAWVVGRPELMMALFVLASLSCELRGRRWAALLLFGFGLLSKEQAVVLPALLLLVDLCLGLPFRTSNEGSSLASPVMHRASRLVGLLARRYLPYVVVLTVYLGVRLVIMGGFQPPKYAFLASPLEHLEGLTWTLNVLKPAGQYLWLAVWPAALAVDYSYNAIPLATGWLDPGVLWAVGAWGGLFVLALWGWKRDRRVTLAVGLTGLTFAPVSNVLISVGTPMAERLFYLPLAGLCLLAAWAYERLTAAVRGSTFAVRSSGQPESPHLEHQTPDLERGQAPALPEPVPLRRTSYVARVCVALVCVALAGRTVVRLQDWQSNETLFRSAVSVVPANAKAHALLGNELKKKREWQQAVAEYRKALELYPEYLNTDAWFATNFGGALLDIGHQEEALAALKMAVELMPRWSHAHYNLGVMYAKLGKVEETETEWRQAVALSPDDPKLHSGLSRLFIEHGRYVDGLAAAETALVKDPKFVHAAYNRALALQMLGRVNEAVTAYEGVLAMPAAPEEAKLDVARKLEDLRRQTPLPIDRNCLPGMLGC